MFDHIDAEPGAETITELVQRTRVGSAPARDQAARELLAAVHRAVYPMCLKLLGSADDAYEAEAETIARLLARLSRKGDAMPIANGTAYVHQIARHICNDLHAASRYRHDRPADDLGVDAAPAVADHASTMYNPVVTPTFLDEDIIATFGYTSHQALADLACLSRQELKVVILRQEGYRYAKIAAMLGAGLSAETVQRQGERGIHKLRGIAHVGVWRQQSVAEWSDPPCPVLAKFKTDVREQLRHGKKITALLYQQIGQHLDPDPNRRPGDKQLPLCRACIAERERSRREYWWLLMLLMPLPLLDAEPASRPVAFVSDAEAPAVTFTGPLGLPPIERPRNKRADRVRVGAVALLVLLLLGIAGLVLRPRHTDGHTGDPAAASALTRSAQPAQPTARTTTQPASEPPTRVSPPAVVPTTVPDPPSQGPSLQGIPSQDPPTQDLPTQDALLQDPPSQDPPPAGNGSSCPDSPEMLCPGKVLYSDHFLQSLNGWYRLYTCRTMAT